MADLMKIPVTSLTGESVTLEKYKGKVLLVVNTASECGFTPQYAALEAIYRHYHHRGFEVLGFPSNDFGNQEPGSAQQIGEFCSTKFFVTFPMFDKISVSGEAQHPLYAELIAEKPLPVSMGPGLRKGLTDYAAANGLPAPNPLPGVLWNFEKFLVGKDGKVLARWETDVKPDDPMVVKAIEDALRA